jgi:hypothetical protein
MAGPEKELNKHRPTICKNCIHFDSRIDPYFKTTICGYIDRPTEAEDNYHCSYYRQVGDPI